MTTKTTPGEQLLVMAESQSLWRVPALAVDAQLDVLRWLQSPASQRWLHSLQQRSQRPLAPTTGLDLAGLQRIHAAWLESVDSPTTWISADAARLVEDASVSIPHPGGAIGAGVVTAPSGMMWIAGDPAMIHFDQPIVAVSWTCQRWPMVSSRGMSSTPAAVITCWIDDGHLRLPLGPIICPLGNDAAAMIDDGNPDVLGQMVWSDTEWPGEHHAALRWQLAAWVMCGQVLPRLIEPVDRARRRRAERLRALSPMWGDIHVTTLRRMARSGVVADGDPGDHEHLHRWVVRGHWRWQSCGPQHTLRRLTWVRPHVKGPEDGNLIAVEQVDKLIR